MASLLTLFGLLAGGYAFGKSSFGKTHSARASHFLNRWVIRVALPALAFQKIHALPEFSLDRPEIYFPASQPWFQFSLALVVLSILKRFFKMSLSVWAALVMTVGLGNTSFVGLPVLNALLGPESLATGIIQDQLGSFLVLSVIGIPFTQMISSRLESKAGSGSVGILNILSRPLRFPAFIALVLAVLLSDWQLPAVLGGVLGLLSSSLSPAALLSVGMMVRFSSLKRPEVRHPLALGLVLKLILFPTFFFWAYPQWAASVGGVPALVLHTVLLESAMASQIMAGLISAEEGLSPELARLMVGVSIPLSLVSVSVWSLFLP
jgi:predicted permease